MKNKFLLLIVAVISMFQHVSALSLVGSAIDNDTWYHIKCSARNTESSVWLTGAPEGGNITIADLKTTDDSQYWKVVSNANGYALINKQFGTYLNADHDALEHILAVGGMPKVALQLINSATKKGGYLLADTMTEFDELTNAAKTTPVFVFYAAGSGYNFHPANIVDYNPPLLHSSVYFLTVKDMLIEEIKRANDKISEVSEGYNPGQFSHSSLENFQYYIDDAQDILDDSSSTDSDYFLVLTELKNGYTSLMNSVITPKVSTNADYWYYIQGLRPVNTYMTAPEATSGAQIKSLSVIPDETQLWRLVLKENGFLLQNKATMEYLSTDVLEGENIHSQVQLPVNSLRFIVSDDISNGSIRFLVENVATSTNKFRLHAGGAGNNWGLVNYTYDASDNCTWLFISEDELYRVAFKDAIKSARDAYQVSVEGDEFGQYTATVRESFLNLILEEESKDMSSMSQEELKDATKVLTDAIKTFYCNRDIKSLADVTKVKWFRFINNYLPSTTYSYGKAMSSEGRHVDVTGDFTGKFTFMSKDADSEEQLFSFDMSADGKHIVAIKNKAHGYYLGYDGHILSSPEADTQFELTPLDYESFWIKPVGHSPLHAASYNTEIVNWHDVAGSASAWKIEFVKSENVADLTTAYVSKRKIVRDEYNAVNALAGNDFGQYSIESVQHLGTVISAEEAKDVTSMTQEEMLKGIQDMISAVATLHIFTDVKLLVSPQPNVAKWYRIVNAADPANAAYAAGKVMSSVGRSVLDKFTYDDYHMADDAQLFRFELNEDQTKVATIINKASDSHVGYDGAILSDSQVDNNFEVVQLAGGRSFWLHPTYVYAAEGQSYRVSPLHAAEFGTEIVNWSDGVGSASAWHIELVKEETTSIKNVPVFNYTVRTNNNIVTVDGVNNFEVFSVLGQKQNIKMPLKPGVYFVQVKGLVKKIVIR